MNVIASKSKTHLPKEIEKQIAKHPGITECQLLSVLNATPSELSLSLQPLLDGDSNHEITIKNQRRFWPDGSEWQILRRIQVRSGIDRDSLYRAWPEKSRVVEVLKILQGKDAVVEILRGGFGCFYIAGCNPSGTRPTFAHHNPVTISHTPPNYQRPEKIPIVDPSSVEYDPRQQPDIRPGGGAMKSNLPTTGWVGRAKPEITVTPAERSGRQSLADWRVECADAIYVAKAVSLEDVLLAMPRGEEPLIAEFLCSGRFSLVPDSVLKRVWDRIAKPPT
jgi:hypothetical protein